MIVIFAAATLFGQLPEVTVLVMVYTPATVVVKSISPVDAETKFNPAGEEVNVPAMPPPVNVGNGLPALIQYGLPL